ncbi:hypothetical protein [Rhizobium herbae]|uniref:Uncharacterized protein n=1 Tax=Rhizobium herbae TaxID=508661 RepID=A0ABS4EUP4_9HYPH|nr:hypothetical protein [Rhizobium herbae]MBP1861650.1 hypothetical protein [Rhizobium herbae]
MGREAITRVEIGGDVADVRALLESTELILRGDIRRRFPRDRLTDVRVDGEALSFRCESETIALHLGALVAEKWVKAIATPPPSLRAKLGLEKDARVFLIGTCDDAALADALEDRLTGDIAEAAMIVARIGGPDDMVMVQAAHAKTPDLPVWTIYPKGKNVHYGDRIIRNTLRDAGFHDTKSCAVSDRLTATRYNAATVRIRSRPAAYLNAVGG